MSVSGKILKITTIVKRFKKCEESILILISLFVYFKMNQKKLGDSKMMKKFYALVLLYCFSLILLATQCTGLRPNPQLTDRGGTNSEAPRSGYPLNTRVATNGEFEDAMWNEIEKYLGVRYRWGGTSRYGMDCSGFVLTVYRDAIGLKLPRKVRDMFRRGEVVSRRQLTFGDLVFFEKIESSGVSHVGIYLDDDEFVHASTSAGVVVSSLTEEYYRERFVGGRRVTRR